MTRELARREDAAGLLWRLSVANVDRDAPFSRFDGLFRILTVIDGAGLRLIHPGGVIDACPREPVRFAGDLPIRCELVGGPVRDFNTIFDPKRLALTVDRLRSGASKAPAGSLGVFPLAGPCNVAKVAVPVGSFACFDDIRQAAEIVVGEAGSALLVRIG